ncbi:MAG: hypothetical protein LBR98_00270 [Syntrophomonadaceae bacterium]|jgi:hypothetical protein|nr:hypothetical protein [Syntrophomonadaceae bacterium]
MKKFDEYKMKGLTLKDHDAILKALEQGQELYIDSHGKVWTAKSNGVCIADAITSEFIDRHSN